MFGDNINDFYFGTYNNETRKMFLLNEKKKLEKQLKEIEEKLKSLE